MPTIEPQDPRLTIDEIMSLSQGAYAINFYGQVPTITILCSGRIFPLPKVIDDVSNAFLFYWNENQKKSARILGLMNVILTMKRN